MMNQDMQNKCPQHDGDHQWAVIRVDPPLSECQNCRLVVDSLEGDCKEIHYSTDNWVCKKCKKKQDGNDTPNLNGSFCSKCWRKWKCKPYIFTTKQATDKHPHFKNKFLKNCRMCRAKEFEDYITKLSCPNCDYPALKRVTSRTSLELGSEIRCDACLTHWGRTRNW